MTSMPWIPDPSCGDWIRDRLDPESSSGTWTIHTFVPRGFEAYARVLHPLERADDGDELEAPAEGTVPTGLLAQLAAHLARHTRTPGRGVVGVWEGHGGLVSSAGRSTLIVARRPRGLARLGVPWRRIVKGWRRWRFERRHRRPRNDATFQYAPIGPGPPRPEPGTGILDAEAAAGPRLDLPYRSHVLFEAGIERFTDSGWIAGAPWLDETDRRHSDPQTPAILWPQDHAWVVANDTDDAWTLVAGSRELIADLVADLGLEALELPEGATLDHADPPVR